MVSTYAATIFAGVANGLGYGSLKLRSPALSIIALVGLLGALVGGSTLAAMGLSWDDARALYQARYDALPFDGAVKVVRGQSTTTDRSSSIALTSLSWKRLDCPIAVRGQCGRTIKWPAEGSYVAMSVYVASTSGDGGDRLSDLNKMMRPRCSTRHWGQIHPRSSSIAMYDGILKRIHVIRIDRRDKEPIGTISFLNITERAASATEMDWRCRQ